MTIEERLAQSKMYLSLIGPAPGVFEPGEIDDPFDLALQLVGVLREIPVPMVHTCPGPMTQKCRCGLSAWEKRRDALLDGGTDGDE